MRPRTISATSIESYLGCPKRFAAEMAKIYTSSAPASYGSCLHAALDKYIEKMYGEDGRLLDPEAGHNKEMLRDLWTAAVAVFLPYGSDYIAEGYETLERWCDSRALPEKVLSREIKETFDIVVPGYEDATQKVTYICDRVDINDDGIEVIDYKSQWEMMTPDKMRRLIQPILYAAAMRRKYGVEKVTVTYDMLRYDEVSVIFSARELDDFERYLGAIAKQIWDDDNPRETVNKKCQWCIRKGVCSTLRAATEVGWTPSMPIEELLAIRNNYKDTGKAIEYLLKEVDEVILQQLRELDTEVLDTGDFIARAASKATTKYDPEVVLRVLGHDAIPYMSVGKTALDKELKRKRNNIFSPEQISTIKDLAITTYGEPHLVVDPKGVTDID